MNSSSHVQTSIRAVIFDCDGTLVDTETSGMTALHGEAQKLGYPVPLEQALHDFRGRRMADCFAMVEGLLGRPVPPDFETTVRQAMADRFHLGVMAIPGAAVLLEALRQAGVPFGIASNGPQAKMKLTLGLAGLQGWFAEERIFSAYDIGSWKPAPGLFLHAAQALGAAPAHCAVVEDSLPGIEAGLAAGMLVYSMCDPATVPAAMAAQVVQIAGLEALLQLAAQPEAPLTAPTGNQTPTSAMLFI